MKTSFYFVLFSLAYLSAILLDIPFLNEYGIIFASIIVFIISLIIHKLFKNIIEYQNLCEVASIMEMAYNNDYKKYKRQAQLKMILYAAAFVYFLLGIIVSLISFSNVSLISYIIWSACMILTGIYLLRNLLSYLKIKKAKHIILDKEFQNIYSIYKNERDTCTYEEMLLPRPKFYPAINAVNTIFAIISIAIALLTFTILYTYKEVFNSVTIFIGLGGLSIIYGIFFIYFGIKDLLSTSSNQKYIFLLLSCVIAALLYMPITNYINKVSLEARIANDPNLSYDAKNNIVQTTIISDEIRNIKTTYFKQRSMIILSSDDTKELLKKTISIGAEFQFILKDKSGNKKVVTISPSELKEIYHQTKSNLDILLEIIRLDFEEAKVYDDGEYIIIESMENAPYPTQPEEIKTLVQEITKLSAEVYDIKAFNKGLKTRYIYNNQQFIEYTLSLDELKKIEYQTSLDKAGKSLYGLFNIHSYKAGN